MMLRIHKPNHKLLTLGITSICGIGGLLGLQALTYTPELSHAETVTYKPTINDITYMQEMTPEICQNMELEKQYQLTDKRDDKVYWVAKLKDGNCWMTQNLDLDLDANKTLTSADSDVTNWTPTNNIQTGTSPNFTTVTNDVQSWDPAGGDGRVTYCNDEGIAGKCKESGNSTTSINDGHDAQGNYYSWGATTAGQAANIGVSGKATQSICPKGWMLPYSSGSKSFYSLLSEYGLRSHTPGTAIDGVTYSADTAPLYFIYGGDVYGSNLFHIGSSGYYWSSVAYTYSSAVFAYIMVLSYNANVGLSNDWRYNGDFVRCVARDETNNNVEITVNNTISLDVVSEVTVEKGNSNPSTSNLDVKVASNQPYKVQIHSTSPTLTSTINSTTIPSRSGALNTNVNGWGIKLSSNSTYSQITSTPTTFYTASGAEVKTIPFTIGISTSPDLPNGEYSTAITVTATQN